MKFTFEADDLDILQGIVEESTEHLNGIEEGILRLENDFTPELVDSIFRALHSIKGVASFVDFVPIKDTAHTLESFMTDMKKGVYLINSDITDVLLRGVDIINLLVGQLGVRVKDLESNPPREAFELSVDDFGFREFVQEAEQLRTRTAQNIEAAVEKTEPEKSTDITPELAKPAAGVMKLEISSFREQMIADFIEETVEHLDTIEQKCVELERHSGDPEILNTILRGFHSIKGGAGVISSMQEQDNPRHPVLAIKSLTHATETLLQTYRNQSRQPSSEVIDLILATVDKVAVLTRLVKENGETDESIDYFMTRIESLSEPNQEEEPSSERQNNDMTRLPQQMAAFINITSQALDSMLSIINTGEEKRPVNKKRAKQYRRALNSIISTARYLDYDEVVQVAEECLLHLDEYSPETDLITGKLLKTLKDDYNKVKQLLDLKIANIHELLKQVPAEYSQKRIGEILVAEKKVTPEELNEALSHQKKIGQILVDNGIARAADVEMAAAKQAMAREKGREVVEQTRTSPEISGQSIRVSQEKLDRLMNMIGELLISKNRVFHLAGKISLEYEMPALSREIKSVASELARISDELQDAIMSARMIPLRVLFQRYPRTIRDTAKKAGKLVELSIEGEDTELDKTVIEAINDPLVHMLRNAVDHAIELPEERKKLGKSPTGNIILKAYYQGNYVVIIIADDGKGLNADEIKLKALKKGLLRSEQIEHLSNDEAYQLIFAPGFSTKDTVSELSGRGVGMDVVKNNIEGVGGSVSLVSTIQAGTTFTLKIPLSMSIIKGLMVESSGQQFIIPLDSIEETVKIPRDNIRNYKKSMVADIREEIVPLANLHDILGMEGSSSGQNQMGHWASIVVINVDDLKFGVIVDSFQKEQEFVVKAMAEDLASLKIYTGATIMGDGSVVLILNPAHFLQNLAGDESRRVNYGINDCAG